MVPAAVKRTVGIAPNFLWDKSAYVLGRTAGEGKRTAQEHAAFVASHLERLADQTDEGLVALRRFLETWLPEYFDGNGKFPPDLLDSNFILRVVGDRSFLHDRPAAPALAKASSHDRKGAWFCCLISGVRGPGARRPPTCKTK